MTTTDHPGSAGEQSPPLDDLAARLDEALARTDDLDPLPRQLVRDVLDSSLALHRQALVTMVRRLRADPDGKRLLFELVDDPGVHMVLAMHGIVRPDPTTQARAALDGLGRTIDAHRAQVDLVQVADRVAVVRLTGSGCDARALAELIESTLLAAVAGLERVEVVRDPSGPTLIPLAQVSVRGHHDPPAGWVKTVAVTALPAGQLTSVTLRPDHGDSVEAIIVNSAGRYRAYVNACAHQGLPLDRALVDDAEGTLTCPWHGLCYDASDGECLTLPGARLQPLGLRVDAGHLWVQAVP
jgi:nitrite reductase/ring-hydroxylating ferredoxin subunit